jgi:hypothetical protein
MKKEFPFQILENRQIRDGRNFLQCKLVAVQKSPVEKCVGNYTEDTFPKKLETSPKRPSPSPPQLWGSNKIRNMDFVETTRSCSKKLEGSLTLHLTPSREHRVTSTRCPRSREACLRSTRWSPRSRFLRSTRGYRQWECLPRSNLKFSLEISPRKPWVLFNPPRTITHRPRPGQRPHPPLLNLLQSTSDTRLRVRSNTASTRKGISPSGGRSDRA